MNQWQYDTICATVKKGAPALAEELIGSLQALVEDYQAKCKELDATKDKLDNYKKEAVPVVEDQKKEQIK